MTLLFALRCVAGEPAYAEVPKGPRREGEPYQSDYFKKSGVLFNIVLNPSFMFVFTCSANKCSDPNFAIGSGMDTGKITRIQDISQIH